MKLKWLVILISTYLIAFATNIFLSMKHPGSAPGSLCLITTLGFSFGLILFIIKAPRYIKVNQGLKLFLIFGSLSGLIVFVIGLIEGALSNIFISDFITAIQYPVYFVFTTPLFGLNYLIDLSYQLFSFIMSFVYFSLFAFMFKAKKTAN